MKLFIPQDFSEVKDMKRFASRFATKSMQEMGAGIWKYVEEASTKGEHCFRVYENASCWGFDNVGARLSFTDIGGMPGMLNSFEKDERDWAIMETKCIGLGDPYCEFKLVPQGTEDLRGFLEGIDSSVVEEVHRRLIDQFVGFVAHGRPLVERPTLGNGIMFARMFSVTSIPAMFSERYRMALRMGGARAGKRVGEELIDAGMEEDEVIRRVVDFMEYCKVGKISVEETIRMKDNCESAGLATGEPSCHFTTAFLNGLFSAVKSQRVREIKCIAAGDPYCEWETI